MLFSEETPAPYWPQVNGGPRILPVILCVVHREIIPGIAINCIKGSQKRLILFIAFILIASQAEFPCLHFYFENINALHV